MAPKVGWRGRNHEIRVMRTKSGKGFRIRDRAKRHDAYAYPNSGGNVVVKFDDLHCIWYRPNPANWPAHRLPPHSLHRAVYYLIGMTWETIAEDKRTDEARRRWEKNKPICRSCGQPEPTPGYVDRRTRQCQLCDDMAIDLAEECEAKHGEQFVPAFEESDVPCSLAGMIATIEEDERRLACHIQDNQDAENRIELRARMSLSDSLGLSGTPN